MKKLLQIGLALLLLNLFGCDSSETSVRTYNVYVYDSEHELVVELFDLQYVHTTSNKHIGHTLYYRYKIEDYSNKMQIPLEYLIDIRRKYEE